MNVYMLCSGSMGDTLPFVTIGEAMAARGHHVTIVANEHFENFIKQRGLAFEPSIPKTRYHEFIESQKRQSDIASLREMGVMIIDLIEPMYNLMKERYIPGQTVACSQSYVLGARVAQEKLGLPLATAFLQPMWFRSIHSMPPVDWFPTFLKVGIQNLIDFFLDRRVGRAVMDFRETLGYPRQKKAMRHWWISPQCHFGLFPDWFSPPQPDWPANVVLPGFPLPKEPQDPFDMTEVDAYLNAGDPPLVFTQSSIANEAHSYFNTSIEIAQKLRSRAIFLTPHPELLPDSIPDDMRYFPYVPLERLLHRCKAHLHHGGIGTIAHTLKAGIPQVTVPMVYDQPDNSLRLRPLKVSIDLKPKQYRTRIVVPKLKELMESREVLDRCRDFAERIRNSDPLGTCCDALEQLGEGKSIGSLARTPLTASAR
jgi:UDP:flavonoid glycosyltransferase YjiC (YdhE family)